MFSSNTDIWIALKNTQWSINNDNVNFIVCLLSSAHMFISIICISCLYMNHFLLSYLTSSLAICISGPADLCTLYSLGPHISFLCMCFMASASYEYILILLWPLVMVNKIYKRKGLENNLNACPEHNTIVCITANLLKCGILDLSTPLWAGTVQTTHLHFVGVRHSPLWWVTLSELQTFSHLSHTGDAESCQTARQE